MSQSLAKNLIHLIYTTKGRERLLADNIRGELHRYTAGVLKKYDSPAILINSVEDHIHLLFSLSRNHALCDVVEQAKKGSSKWLKTKGPAYRSFFWQAGYGAFSVSQSNVKQVVRYIERQKEHHRRNSFQEEYREFLKRHEMEYGERYVWD
jgi:REP element-mobilizing transposase RayT